MWKTALTIFVLVSAITSITFQPALAQTMELFCAYLKSDDYYSGELVSIDFGAGTLGVDLVDRAGNIEKIRKHQRAQITEQRITALWRTQMGWIRYTLNRYTMILLWESDMGSGYSRGYREPCVRHSRGPRKL